MISLLRTGTRFENNVDIRPLVEGVVRNLMSRAENKGLKLDFEASQGDFFGDHIDRNYLRLVIDNLLDNAIKYTDAGDIKVRLRKGMHRSDYYRSFDNKEMIVIEVEDSGRGIDDKEKHKIFSSGYRGSNAGSVPGTGFGLSFVNNAIAAMNGDHKVVSVEGKGSIFTVALHISRGIDHAMSERDEEMDKIWPGWKKVMAYTREHVTTILIVDDDPASLKLLAEDFQQYGFKVIKAQNAIEAIAKMKMHQETINAVVSDFALPSLRGNDFHGPELLQELQKILQVPMFIFSGGGVNSRLHQLKGVRVAYKGQNTFFMAKSIIDDLSADEAMSTRNEAMKFDDNMFIVRPEEIKLNAPVDHQGNKRNILLGRQAEEYLKGLLARDSGATVFMHDDEISVRKALGLVRQKRKADRLYAPLIRLMDGGKRVFLEDGQWDFLADEVVLKGLNRLVAKSKQSLQWARNAYQAENYVKAKWHLTALRSLHGKDDPGNKKLLAQIDQALKDVEQAKVDAGSKLDNAMMIPMLKLADKRFCDALYENSWKRAYHELDFVWKLTNRNSNHYFFKTMAERLLSLMVSRRAALEGFGYFWDLYLNKGLWVDTQASSFSVLLGPFWSALRDPFLKDRQLLSRKILEFIDQNPEALKKYSDIESSVKPLLTAIIQGAEYDQAMTADQMTSMKEPDFPVVQVSSLVFDESKDRLGSETEDAQAFRITFNDQLAVFKRWVKLIPPGARISSAQEKVAKVRACPIVREYGILQKASSLRFEGRSFTPIPFALVVDDSGHAVGMIESYIPGENHVNMLIDFIQKKKAVSAVQLVEIYRQLKEQVKILKAAGIENKDLTFENMIVSFAGNRPVVSIIDFDDFSAYLQNKTSVGAVNALYEITRRFLLLDIDWTDEGKEKGMSRLDHIRLLFREITEMVREKTNVLDAADKSLGVDWKNGWKNLRSLVLNDIRSFEVIINSKPDVDWVEDGNDLQIVFNGQEALGFIVDALMGKLEISRSYEWRLGRLIEAARVEMQGEAKESVMNKLIVLKKKLEDLRMYLNKKVGMSPIHQLEAIGLIKVDAAMASGNEVQKVLFVEDHAASSALGGIDMDPANMNLKTRRDAGGQPMTVEPQDLENNNSEGFTPVIINITPVTNLPTLLGMVK